jgi:transcriptional regulator with XRE-family HTH domain
MSDLYDRVAGKPGGETALAAARLRREVLVVLHEAFEASGLPTQSEIAKRLNVRRSAVNQVFRGDGNLRVNTLAEYLFALGFELNISLVAAGEPRRAELENRPVWELGAATPDWRLGLAGNWNNVAMIVYAVADPQGYSFGTVSVFGLTSSAAPGAPRAVPYSTSPQIVLGEVLKEIDGT